MALILTKNDLVFAAEQLCNGHLVAFPTETVYGLGADATDGEAVAQIYETKERPAFNPLIAHYASLDLLKKDVIFTENARLLAEAFWPGPLTLVLKKTKDSSLSGLACAGLTTAAVRMPSHPIAQKLLSLCAKPIVAPSANPSGLLSPTTAAHVQKGLGNKIKWIIEGGVCTEGLESTIVDLSTDKPTILRYGTLTVTELQKIIPHIVAPDHLRADAPKAPGMLVKHYAPSCKVRLSFDNPQPNEGLLAFGPHVPQGFKVVYNLSSSSSLTEAAVHLFDYLHALEESGVDSIAVMPISQEGLGKAIHDKLVRAAGLL